MIFKYSYETYLGFNEEVNLSVSNLPQGIQAIFSSSKLQQSSSSGNLRILGLENLPPQDLILEVFAQGKHNFKNHKTRIKTFK